MFEPCQQHILQFWKMMNHNPNSMYGYEDEYYEYYYDDEDLGLLDPAWERQQKKVCRHPSFTITLYRFNFCNKSLFFPVHNPVLKHVGG